MARLKDIGERVGVSVSVVSKVLNNRMGNTRVRPEVAEAIRATAAALGYRPNPAAVALSSGRQNVLGVFIHRVGAEGSGIVESIIEGISVAARQSGQQRLITMFYDSPEAFETLSPCISSEMIDGLLVVGVLHPELRPRLVEIQRSGLPVVTLHNEPLDERIPNIGIDQERVGLLATRHLIERGCRRIAYIHNMAVRYGGYLKALREAHMPQTTELVCRDWETDFGHRTGEEVVRGLVESGTEFDGVVAQSDAEAIGAINELFRRGVRVPGEVRVIGVDDSPLCALARVPLTSVTQCYRERAERAVRLLLDAVEGLGVSSQVFSPSLRIRASTA